MFRFENFPPKSVPSHGAIKALLRMGGVFAVAVGLLATGPAQAAELIKCAFPYWFGFAPTMEAIAVSAMASMVVAS